MKMRPTEPRGEDIDKVAGVAARLLAIGVPVDLICERLEIGYGEEHWWWKQRRKRDQDNLSRLVHSTRW